MLALAAVSLAAGCGSPPQVVEIAPQRGATEVGSSDSVRIRFDRPMDQSSVAAHFHVVPKVDGTVHWSSDRELVFQHAAFSPSSQYQVVLEPGYRDAQGIANSLRHSWTFRTEAPPALTDVSPGLGDRDVDPATYITLSFSREMDPSTLRTAISLSPAAPFAIRQDGADPRRVVLAPDSLLEPRVTYSVAVNQEARDMDGNRMGAGAVVSFTTGSFRPLRHWIGFVAEASPGSGSEGVWIVNENRFPRRLVSTPVSAFSWSADGSRLLLRTQAGTWSDQPLDGPAASLPIRGTWADFLAPGRGYAFLDAGRLQVLRPDGTVIQVATDVTDAAVAPGGGRLAFVVHDPSGSERATEIDGYDADLRTRYRLQSEPGPVDGLPWSPDGQSLAYRLDAGDSQHRQLRVRPLRGGGTVTVATGDVSEPIWQADRQHLLFTAPVSTPSGVSRRAFRLSVGDPAPKTLDPTQGMPAGGGIAVQSLSSSADGHQLAFVSDAGGRTGVWMMNADGTGVTQLTQYDRTRFPYWCRGVEWTPN